MPLISRKPTTQLSDEPGKLMKIRCAPAQPERGDEFGNLLFGRRGEMASRRISSPKLQEHRHDLPPAGSLQEHFRDQPLPERQRPTPREIVDVGIGPAE